MGKVTNADLIHLNKKGKKHNIVVMGLEDEFAHLRAEGRTRPMIAKLFNKTHPKKSGALWVEDDFYYYERHKKERLKYIASKDDNLIKEAKEATIDITTRLKKLDTILDGWLDMANKKQNIKVSCPTCGEHHQVKVFSPRDAVAVAEAVRRTLLTADRLSKSLPDVKGEKSLLTGSMDVKKFVDKLVKEGALIVADKTKLAEFGL